MLRTRSLWLPALALTSTLLVGSAAEAADPGTGAPPADAARANRFQQALGLSDEQMAAIREVRARHAEERKQNWQALRQARMDLHQLAINGGDPAAIQAKTAQVSELLGQSVQLRVTSLQEISPILSPEQRAKLAQMEQHGFKHRHRGGPRSS